RLALAHAEPGSRFDLVLPESTTAARTGGGFTLNGAKTMVLDGAQAGMLIVSAAAEQGMALFAVEANASGVRRHDYQLIDRSHASDMLFDNVRVDERALIAMGPAAFDLVDEATDRATLAAVAQTLGVMEAAVAVANEHIKNR